MRGLWETLSAPWQVCLEEAWAAYCAGSIPVGAVVTDAAGRILTRARNRTFERGGETMSLQVSPLAHAELAALEAIDYERVDPHVCVLYSSQEPCPLCLGALYMSGVREIHFAGRDPYAGSTDLLGTTAYLRRKPIRVIPPASPVLETVVSAITREFGVRCGTRRQLQPVSPPAWLEAWAEMLPEAVRLSERIVSTGWLNLMRTSGASTAAVIDGLAAQIEE